MERLQERIDRGVGHIFTRDEIAEFDRHLGVCPSCMAYLDSYKKTVEMEQSVVAEMAEDPCADAPEELVRAVLKARKRKN